MPHAEYDALKRSLARGWNTWNVRSVLSHVLLPQALALNLAVREPGGYLKEALIGRQGAGEERVRPGTRTWDGRYTQLELTWRGLTLQVESATDGDDLLLLLTPRRPCTIVLEASFLWNRPGVIRTIDRAHLLAQTDEAFDIFAAGPPAQDPAVPADAPHLAIDAAGPVGFCTGRLRTLQQIDAAMATARQAATTARTALGASAELYAATQTCLAWDTIYDPAGDRVISPVSRLWSVGSGGFVLFCWDNYFAGFLASLENKPLAYANVIEITRAKTDAGFVPNFVNGGGTVSRDRSQPPVGTMMVREIFRRHREPWLLELLFDDLLAWNRWWPAHRRIGELLAWGSTPYAPVTGNRWETDGVNARYGAALESGLDNSPMYDEIPFDSERHVLQLHDVGLNSLYIADCDALADIARVLRRPEASELSARADGFRSALQQLWHEPTGLFLNRRTDTGEFTHRLSPTHFYPLLARAAWPAQARRMIAEHLYNPAEFWGEHVLPSIARNDPAYPDQDYWRGRIWAPMNFLVYLGLRNYQAAQAQSDLAARSAALLLGEWRSHGHVHENYNATTGAGCDAHNSDRFYHWGALLASPALIEAGHYPAPENPLG